jgi:hypothetical protein
VLVVVTIARQIVENNRSRRVRGATSFKAVQHVIGHLLDFILLDLACKVTKLVIQIVSRLLVLLLVTFAGQ